jgi:hypothetical protein
MTVRLGIHGMNVVAPSEDPKTGHVNLKGALFSQNTNVHPAFGMDYKIKRNRNVVGSVVGQTWGYHASKKGYNVFGNIQNKLHDPLHRDPMLILLRARQEASIAGRERAYIRPAAPLQVTWKNQYWVLQRTRGARGTTIGPYGNPTSNPSQSILARIAGGMGIGGQ